MEALTGIQPIDSEPEPLSKTDVAYERIVHDTKARALQSLCQLQISGKGDDDTRKLLKLLAQQIAKL